MRRRIKEAVDLELAVVKSLNGANLSVDEIEAMRDLTTRDLMFDYDLDYLLADRVRDHLKGQEYRATAQDQETPLEDYEPIGTSLTRSFPIEEGRRLTSSGLRRLVLRMISEERLR
jgi:hypothetical protein